MTVVLRTAAARAKTNAIRSVHAELKDGGLPERILLRTKEPSAENKEWEEILCKSKVKAT